MNKKLVLSFCILITSFLLFGCSRQDMKSPPKAISGVIDLSHWDYAKDGPLNLSGDWEFYPNQLLSPSDFLAGKNTNKLYVAGDKPLNWQNFPNCQNISYGTYHLTILQSRQKEILALKTPTIFSSCKLFINGAQILKLGNPSESIKFYNTGTINKIIPFEMKDTEDIIIQFANYTDARTGIESAFEMGRSTDLFMLQSKDISFNLFLSGCTAFMGFYFITFYFIARRERAALMFGIACVSYAVWFVLYLRIIKTLFDIEEIFIMLRVEHILIFVSVVSILYYFYLLYPNEYKRWFLTSITILNFGMSMIVVFGSTHFYRELMGYFAFVELIALMYTVYVVFRASRKKRNESFLLLIGFSILAICMTSEMINHFGLANTYKMANMGAVVFLLFQAILLSQRFSQAFQSIEIMSKRLSIINKLKDEFLANTSHELRTPLNGIIGISESLINGTAGKLETLVVENLKMIVSSGKRLTSLVNDLLDFSKLKNRDILLRLQDVDLRQAAEVVLTVTQAMLDGKNIKLLNNIPETLPCALADENRIQQILYNIIGNAVKFTKEGSIEITAVQNMDEIEVIVSDTGIGIPQDKLENIFISFEQVDSSTEREFGGTGLGLSITKQLVELQGGKIWVTSKLNEGSTFHLTLPIGTEQHSTQTGTFPKISSSDALETPILNKPFEQSIVPMLQDLPSDSIILVVDDEKINRQVLFNHLTLESIAVDMAENGLQALEKINTKQYDLVLLDIMMPKMSGYEVLRKLREKYTNYEMPVLLLTAKNQPNDIVTGFSAGANDYVLKPFDRSELISRVKTLIDLKHSVQNVLMLNDEITQTQKEMIFTLGEVAEARSKETGNHVRRVAEYTYLLALKYGLSKEESYIIQLASPMHDIGKLAIPDQILNKPGALTKEEFEVIKTHSLSGYEILNKSNRKILQVAAIIALEHHEKFDGTGYPKGIKGHNISNYGRITAICDVFDALASERVYKKAWEMDKILDHFHEQSGKHFDPELMDLFLSNLPEFLAIKDKYVDKIIVPV